MKNNLVLTLFAVGTIALRLLPHAPNVAPIGALALLLGSFTTKRKAIGGIIVVMLISDAVIGFHPLMSWVYGSFALMAFIPDGMKKLQIHNKLLYAISASLLFFLLTNFAVWLQGNGYPQTIQGLMQCYLNAIPFLRNTLIGDIGFTLVFFELYKRVMKLDIKRLPYFFYKY